MGTYDSIAQVIKEAEGSSEYEQMLEMLQDSFGETVTDFLSTRGYAMAIASLPRDEFLPKGSGKLPFVLDDGETCYAVIYPDRGVKPLPFGYELDDDDLAVDDDTVLMSTIAFSMPDGFVRYIPVCKDFQPPDEEAFEIERLIEQALADDTDDSVFEFDGLKFSDDIFLDAKSGEPFTGVATLHWENETLKKEAHFSEGALDGRMTWWYESGQKELEDDYVDNKRHGKHRAWHENGELWAEGSSINGDRQGTWKWWHDNAQLAEEAEYKDGLADGKSEKWHANGKRALLTTFEEDVEQGIHKEWYESGQLQAIVPMMDGEMHGTLQLWDESGEKTEDIEFVEGEQIMNASEEAASEEIEDLKDRIMYLVESKESKAAVEGLIFTVEEAAGGDLDQVAEALQEVIDDLEQKLETAHSDIEAKAPLVNATVEGDVKEIRRLLKEGAEADVGPPGFVYAIAADQPKAFEVYVKHGIDVSKQFDWENPDGSSVPDVNAFILAAAGGTMWAVKRLLDLGVDPNVETSMGQTALEVAISGGQDEVVDILFDNMSDVSRPSAGRVLVAAAMAGNTEVASRCLKAGIPVDATDSRGWTALKYAVSNGNLETAELLLEHGADCNIPDNEDWTPLLTAIESRDLDLVNLLLSKNADPNTAPEIEDDEGNHGFSALMRAAHYGEVEILEALIVAGADVEQTDSDGATAVHYAASHRHPNCIKILLDHGTDPNSIGVDGHSPVGMFLVGLVGAVQERVEIDQGAAIKTLNLLIKHGANWQEAADKIARSVGEVAISVLDVAKLAVKKEGLKKLLKALDRVGS